MTQKILTAAFHLLFFLTPLIWLPINFELFEYNKMVFVYMMTVVITGVWVIKIIESKSLIINRTPLDIPLLLFLPANILSTIFSLDPHLSLWGYYSRSNGGLLSLISYLLLYYALVSNFQATDAVKFLKSAVWGGVLVSLYAIPEHFGISPSCVLLTQNFNASCWVQDVQARVFATLGQPNWLAAYLAMLIFPVLYFAQTAKSKPASILYTLYSILFYLAFTFTYSRGATLGLLAGLGAFLSFYFLAFHPSINSGQGLRGGSVKLISLIGFIFLAINLTFGSAFTSFTIFSNITKTARPTISASSLSTPTTTQLETGGTESGQIRLIVWQGALEIFKHYPLFGSGVETFAYAYYNFRPTQHNLVSEWDYLYNKAHNEFLNYLATTGLVGFLSYLGIIGVFIFWATQRILNFKFEILNQLSMNKLSNPKAVNQHPAPNFHTTLLILAILSSYTAYLVQNFFGFSVVIVALFFYLFPALTFLITNSTKPLKSSKYLTPILHPTCSMLQAHTFLTLGTKLIVIIISLYLLLTLGKFWTADFFFAQGLAANQDGSAAKAYKNLSFATQLNPYEPYYQSELAYAAASAAVLLDPDELEDSTGFKLQSINLISNTLKDHPYNVSFYKTAVRTYYLLSTVDPTYLEKTLTTLDQAITLAPTDPKLTYNKAVILDGVGKSKEAIELFKQTLELKPDYKDAHLALGAVYLSQKEKKKAIEQAQAVLKYYPQDSDALEKLETWSKDEKNK